MKKTYINPETLVIEVEAQVMSETSNMQIQSGTKDFDNSLSRERGGWDDED